MLCLALSGSADARLRESAQVAMAFVASRAELLGRLGSPVAIQGGDGAFYLHPNIRFSFNVAHAELSHTGRSADAAFLGEAPCSFRASLSPALTNAIDSAALRFL